MSEDGLNTDVVLAAEALGMLRSELRLDAENTGYGSAVSGVEGCLSRFRVARVTPQKAGLFVAVWRRAADGGTEPYPEDAQMRMVIVTREGLRFGAFVFPATVLAQRGVTSAGGRDGKRGFRVYPPWSVVESAQAVATQRWQCEHFVTLDH
ncbi:MepB family protein [Leifsonia sp. 2MCAF36]|uniref:MepB family protein n=1 Tax=Leifsonia sp. 2MCAF36 TaxID=3232988 RepID=UPI003F9E06CB